MKISFYGAARTVTGSCHMLEWEGGKLLVDCGLRQGADAKGAYGEDRLPFDPKEIDAVLLTHAHIDHTGLLPLLVKRGFSGKVLCTGATEQLAGILLPDSAYIQMQEAEWQSRKNLRAGKQQVEPLYNLEDAKNALKLFCGVDYGEMVQLFENVRVRMQDVGHLLGSAAVEIFITEQGKTTKAVFSGDLGRSDRPIIRDPQFIKKADYLVIEGTYGDRNHGLETDADKEAELCEVLQKALARGGNIVVPSFAVGRTQELLYYIKRILNKNLLPELNDVPVYIDSPLGINATKIYESCAKGYFDEEATEMAKEGSLFDFPTLRIAQTADESKLINTTKGRKIIISSSGMCDAGRIRHHLKHNLYRADSTVLFVGYQAQGTLGRTLIDGAKKVKMFGEEVRVNAGIVQIEGFSGHAGRDELIAWVEAVDPKPKNLFLVHGEERGLNSLGDALRDRGYKVTIPSLGEQYDISAAGQVVVDQSTIAVTEKAADTAIAEQLLRINTLLESKSKRSSPEMELMLKLLEADIKSMADKWEQLL